MSVQLSPPCQHECRLHEDLAPVVQRKPFTMQRYPCRDRVAQPQTVGKTPRACSPTWTTTRGSTGFHNDATHARAVHFGSPLLVRSLLRRQQQFPYMEGFSAEMPGQFTRLRE